ncbi:(2Fe-2S)-binding protein [Methylomarinovum caldicuralii]|uniref:(2Fe-2S)-binding protein n=1 Tax=Methylomarinovum caldicuralii TaxID=438856 RepID=UPI003BF58B88
MSKRIMYVCLCHGVTDRDIRQSVHQGATTMSKLCKRVGCGTQCGKCVAHVRQVRDLALAEINDRMATEARIGCRFHTT